MKEGEENPSKIAPELRQALAQLRDGDTQVLGRIIHLTRDRLFRFCYHLAGSQTAADELCQETYIKALSGIATLKAPHELFAWLFKIARNHYIDEIRTPESKLRALQKNTDNNEEEDPLARIPDASREDLAELLAVREALQRLSPEEREVILLIDHEEYSYGEAAGLLGLSESAVRSRLHRARKAFLKIFDQGKEVTNPDG